ncbi:FecR domain-containing protein [Halotalea alkalilenta]|uniref:Iron dicitrate transport regulator FecR n=1 Tax=Halotalea alkalilenta TaxID=376489 RepID=A0A172YDT3_9GAMM|nr:FecR domain-containing protein [Halotalea alkalilenta]ANF57418.1 hypothetical protein A5892_08030 [Halotalea alkalilenta]
MSDAEPPLSSRVAREAARWWLKLEERSSNPSVHAAFERWLSRDPQHLEAWQRLAALDQRISALPPGIGEKTLDGARRQRRMLLKTTAMVAIGLPLAAEGTRRLPWSNWLADQRTAVGERREITLADGGRLWLNTASAADIEYDRRGRRLRLIAGELVVRTAADVERPARPFFVDTPSGRVEALGTYFGVRLEGATVDLLVLEGRVRVDTRGGASRTIDAGQSTRFNRDEIALPTAGDTTSIGWTQGLLYAEDWRLDRVVEELARYRSGWLSCDPAVAALRISAVLRLDDVDAALATIAASLPVRVRYRTRYWATLGTLEG